MFCSPSARPIVSVSGLNAPASMFNAPPVNDGLNGRLGPGHALPFGPFVTANGAETFFVAPPQDTNDVSVE